MVAQGSLEKVLPCILNGLADQEEGVRNAALAAGHKIVEIYATSNLSLLLPVVEAGIFAENWRIRHSSVELLGDLLFKVNSSEAEPKRPPSFGPPFKFLFHVFSIFYSVE